MKSFNEIELLSSYLDGQLNEAESKRLETRIAADPELASVLSDLRATRSILRKLPVRKAPKNFTLTRKMVGLKPPLPRSYPIFRFSTAFATILLMLTFALNSLFPPLGVGGAGAPAPEFGYGGGPATGSGGGCDTCPLDPALQSAAVATEAPAATEAPVAAAEAFTTATPSLEMQIAPTADGTLRETEPAADTFQAPKEGEPESVAANQEPINYNAMVPSVWQVILAGIILLSALGMWLAQRSAYRKWQ